MSYRVKAGVLYIGSCRRGCIFKEEFCVCIIEGTRFYDSYRSDHDYVDDNEDCHEHDHEDDHDDDHVDYHDHDHDNLTVLKLQNNDWGWARG